jgi:AbrB family looped-hinge helix DNA binding protein
VNFLDGDNQAMTNAAAHVGFSLAIPLLGEHFWGRKGLWISGLSWMAFTLVQESMFHAPANPGPGYPAEVRSDLITRLVPCATLLVIDALTNGGRASAIPDRSPSAPAPPEPPGMPWPLGLELPSPAGRNPEGEPAPSFSRAGEALQLRFTILRDPVAEPTAEPRASAERDEPVATLTPGGRITLPPRVLERLGVKPGDRIVFRETPDGTIVVEAEIASRPALLGAVEPRERGVTPGAGMEGPAPVAP